MSTLIYEIISADLKFHAPYTHRVVLLCLEKEIPYQITPIDLQNKPTWFLKIAPVGEVPVMRINDGVVTDSFAIAKYLDNLSEPSYILSQDNQNYPAFLELIAEINAFGKALVMFFRNYQFDIAAIRILASYLEKFERLLLDNYLLGQNINYSDLALLPHLLQIEALDSRVFPFSILAKFPRLQCWLARLKNRASVSVSSEGFTEGFIEHIQQRGFYAGLIK